jgi:ribosomal protein L40E
MKCPKCGFENSENSKFCINCASSLSNLEQKICSKCGSQNLIQAKFCINCANKLDLDNYNKKICPQCNAQNPQEAKFCINCSYGLSNSFQNSNFNREEYLRREIQRLTEEKKYSQKKQKNSKTKIAGKVILGVFLGLMLGIGGLFLIVDYYSSGNYTVLPIPKIRISDLDTQISFNLTEGAVAIVDITLTNYGNAGGNAEVEFYNNKNQVVEVQSFYVSAGQTKTFRTKVDISIDDRSIGARLR